MRKNNYEIHITIEFSQFINKEFAWQNFKTKHHNLNPLKIFLFDKNLNIISEQIMCAIHLNNVEIKDAINQMELTTFCFKADGYKVVREKIEMPISTEFTEAFEAHIKVTDLQLLKYKDQIFDDIDKKEFVISKLQNSYFYYLTKRKELKNQTMEKIIGVKTTLCNSVKDFVYKYNLSEAKFESVTYDSNPALDAIWYVEKKIKICS